MTEIIFDLLFIALGAWFYENEKTPWGRIFLTVILVTWGADLAVDIMTLKAGE